MEKKENILNDLYVPKIFRRASFFPVLGSIGIIGHSWEIMQMSLNIKWLFNNVLMKQKEIFLFIYKSNKDLFCITLKISSSF